MFEALYRNISRRLYNYIFSVLRNKADTLDVLQDVFLKIWNNRERLDMERNFEAYIFTVARNAMFRHMRSKLYASFEDVREDSVLEEPRIEDRLSDSAVIRKLYAVIRAMPEQRRRIFLLSRRENLSYREIASRLGISENTVDTQIRRALKELRMVLAQEELLLLLAFFPHFF